MGEAQIEIRDVLALMTRERLMRAQSRTHDPETSKQNSHDVRRVAAALVVLRVMADGIDRSDEQIASDAGECGYTADRLRHGRLLLVDADVIEDSGKRCPTRSGSTARVWRLTAQGREVIGGSTNV